MDPAQIAQIARTSPFYAMQLMGQQEDMRRRQEAARSGAGAQLYQLYGGQAPQVAPPPPMQGGGGIPPPMPGTPQGGPMPPPPGANPAPQGIPPQQRAGMPPPNPGAMPPGQQPGIMPPPPMAGGPPPGGAPMGAPAPAAAPPAQLAPFRPLPTGQAAQPGGDGQIAPPPTAPQQEGDGLQQPQHRDIGALIKQLKATGFPPEKVMDMLDAVMPALNQQNQQELGFYKAQTEASRAAATFYKDRLNIELRTQDLERKRQQGNTRLDQGQQRIGIQKEMMSGGDWSPQDVAYWTEVLQKGGSLPPRLATTPGGKKLLSDIMKSTARGSVSPVEMLANQAEFMGEKAGQRTLGTRTANIEMAATEAAGLSSLALKASEEWNRSGIKSLNDLEKYVQGKTASPQLRRFVAANTSFINAYARAINPQGVGTVADKEHAREMLEVGFAKGDYAAAIDQLQSEISVAQKSPSKVKESMRERFTGGGARQAAPKEALDYLQAHPETSSQFSAKYGYLPAGVR